MELIRIGYWAGGRAEGWPDPARFVDADWDHDEREIVTEYLLRGLVARTYMGLSPCRFCGANNGALELSDGVYLWPQGLAHYLTDHLVRLPPRFVDHIKQMTELLENAAVDNDWWQAQTGPH